MKRKKNLLYSRVSTDEQVEFGYSLINQENRLKEYCNKNAIRNTELIKDEGYSAKNSNRPGYKKILKLIIEERVESLIFLKLDRLSRSKEDFYYLKKLCTVYNVKLISITENLATTAIGELAQDLMIAIAELERKQISERTKAGYVGMLEKGLYPYGGKTPFGISKNKDKTIYYNDDSKIVKKIFDLNTKGYSFAQIGRIISEKYSMKINHSFVEKIIKNNIYRGYILYNDKKYEIINSLLEVETETTGKNNLRKRNLNKFEYFFTKHLSENFLVSAKIKILKQTGQKKEYKYYTSKTNKKLKISEEKLFRMIKNKTRNFVIKKNKKNKMKERLNELFLLGKIKIEEYNELEKEIENLENLTNDISKIDNLQIDEKGNVNVKLSKNKNEIKFNYNKELQVI